MSLSKNNLENLKDIVLKRKNLILFILLIYCLLVMGGTYAYLYTINTNDNMITGDMATAELDLSIERVVPNQELHLVPLLDDALTNAIKGTGGVSSCIDSKNNLSCEVYKISLTNNGTANLELTSTITLISGSTINDYFENLKWRELSDATTIKTDSNINGMSNSVLEDGLYLEVGETKEYYIAIWISETGSDQLTDDYGTYGGIVRVFSSTGIGVTAQFGDTPTLASEHIEALFNDNETGEIAQIDESDSNSNSIKTVHIGNNAQYPQVYLNKGREIILDNNGHYRYYGMDPNNYVYFNCKDYNNQTDSTCEVWRIIGMFKNVDNGSGNLETRVKIIRQTSIGDYAYDTSDSSINSGQGTNDWSQSDLMHLLNPGFEEESINNSLYWTGGSGSCYYEKNNKYKDCDFSEIGITEKSKDYIGTAKFYLGSFPTTVTALMNSGQYVAFMEKFYAHQMYSYERSTDVYDCSVDDGACPRATEWPGKIGLMYPSDYIYATDMTKCSANGIAFGWSDWNHKNLENPKCYTNDWLHTDGYIEWLISPHNTPRYRPFTLQNGKYIFGAYSYHGYEVRPTLYLNSDVFIIKGNGTKTNPYQLYNYK